jgi:hypothetical protein
MELVAAQAVALAAASSLTRIPDIAARPEHLGGLIRQLVSLLERRAAALQQCCARLRIAWRLCSYRRGQLRGVTRNYAGRRPQSA